MDQLTDIYVNEAGPFGYLGKRKSLVKSSESIYENVLIHSLEPNKTAALSGNEHMQTGPVYKYYNVDCRFM